MDAVSQVGGISQNAKTDHVLVISGGVVAPSLKLVDMGGFLYRGELQDNILLRRGDIVYVPKNDLGTAERYFDFAVRAMGPVVSAESAIVLGGSAVNTLHGQGHLGGHEHQSKHSMRFLPTGCQVGGCARTIKRRPIGR